MLFGTPSFIQQKTLSIIPVPYPSITTSSRPLRHGKSLQHTQQHLNPIHQSISTACIQYMWHNVNASWWIMIMLTSIDLLASEAELKKKNFSLKSYKIDFSFLFRTFASFTWMANECTQFSWARTDGGKLLSRWVTEWHFLKQIERFHTWLRCCLCVWMDACDDLMEGRLTADGNV